MSRKIIFLFCLFSTSFFSAQNTDDLLGTWTELIGRNTISEKWSIPTTVILQQYKVLDEFQFLLLRSGITYHFSSNSSASLGYDYFYSESFSEENLGPQHRVWEELAFTSNYSGWSISHRYRLESTWSGKEPEDNLTNRIRYRLKLEHLLYRKWYLTSFNEIFINPNKPYFNQNRIHIGVGYNLNPDLKFEVGYFKNHFTRLHFDRIRLGFVFKTRILSKKNE